LGGKNPNIIFDDAKLEDCIETTIKSSFSNQGEICLCGSRVYVQSGLYDEFLNRFIERTKKIVVGNPSDSKTMMGALISSAHKEKVLSYINLAKQLGGKIEIGGDCPLLPEPFSGGYFVNPTIITGLPNDCKVVQEEIFGPVVTVTKFTSVQEAIDMANNSKYGLSATVWTQNLITAHKVSHALQTGTVWVNCWLLRDLKLPFGGVKASGIGREGGEYSIDFYTEQKTICMKYI